MTQIFILLRILQIKTSTKLGENSEELLVVWTNSKWINKKKTTVKFNDVYWICLQQSELSKTNFSNEPTRMNSKTSKQNSSVLQFAPIWHLFNHSKIRIGLFLLISIKSKCKQHKDNWNEMRRPPLWHHKQILKMEIMSARSNWKFVYLVESTHLIGRIVDGIAKATLNLSTFDLANCFKFSFASATCAQR